MKVRPLSSELASALPSAVTCGCAFEAMVAELYSKLTSRSMLGFACAIETICSRSAVVSDRVVRLRRVFTKRASSALRAASTGADRPRVSLAGFNALMICSADGSSAANAALSPIGKARPTASATPAKLIVNPLERVDIVPLLLFSWNLSMAAPEGLQPGLGCSTRTPVMRGRLNVRDQGRCDGHHKRYDCRGVPIPKFAHPSRRPLMRNSESRGTSNSMILVPL